MTVQEIERAVKESAADALNELADKVAADSLREVPLQTGELRASGQYPANDPANRASADHLEATVSYSTVYAAAQHEGHMVYRREGVDHPIVWVVKHHTEPGTKTKYLEDPFKSVIPRMERFVAARIKARLGG